MNALSGNMLIEQCIWGWMNICSLKLLKVVVQLVALIGSLPSEWRLCSCQDWPSSLPLSHCLGHCTPLSLFGNGLRQAFRCWQLALCKSHRQTKQISWYRIEEFLLAEFTRYHRPQEPPFEIRMIYLKRTSCGLFWNASSKLYFCQTSIKTWLELWMLPLHKGFCVAGSRF